MQSLAACQRAAAMTARHSAARRQTPAEAASVARPRVGSSAPSSLRLSVVDVAQGRRGAAELRATTPVASALGSTSDDDDDVFVDRRCAVHVVLFLGLRGPAACARLRNCNRVGLTGTTSPPSPARDSPDGKPGAPPAGHRWRRVMLKISGEALAGDVGFGIDPDVVELFANEVAESARQGVEVSEGQLSRTRARPGEGAVSHFIHIRGSPRFSDCCRGRRRQLLQG